MTGQEQSDKMCLLPGKMQKMDGEKVRVPKLVYGSLGPDRNAGNLNPASL